MWKILHPGKANSKNVYSFLGLILKVCHEEKIFCVSFNSKFNYRDHMYFLKQYSFYIKEKDGP